MNAAKSAMTGRRPGYGLFAGSFSTLIRRVLAEDPADEIAVTRTPLLPAARHVFSPAELELRLSAIAERVAREDPPPQTRATCDACGKPAPCGNRGLAKAGWAIRFRPKGSEIYCPSCFTVWGWPERFNTCPPDEADWE